MFVPKSDIRRMKINDMMDLARECREEVEKAIVGKTEVDKDTLKVLEHIGHEMLEFSKVYLIKQTDRFYGNFLMTLNTRIDLQSSGPACVTLKKPFTMIFNPLLWVDTSNGKQYTFDNFLGDIVHEIMHVVYGHAQDYIYLKHRLPEANEKLAWAADIPINDTIISEVELFQDGYSRKTMMTGDVITYKTLQQRVDEYASENKGFKKIKVKSQKDLYYYLNILDKMDDDKKKDPDKLPETVNKPGDVVTRFNMPQKQHSFGLDEDSDASELTSSIRQKVNVVWDILTVEQRNALSADMKDYIDEILEPPKLDWRAILSKFAGSIPIPSRRTMMRRNRRQPHRVDLPGRLPDHTVKIVIAIDVSSSMTIEELTYAFNEMKHIFKGRKVDIEIILCTTRITANYTVDSFDKVDMNIKGRGGTQFSPVFEHMADNKEKYRDSLLIYFTDGGGETALTVKPVNNRVIWVITGGPESQMSLKNPVGIVRALEDDKKLNSLNL